LNRAGNSDAFRVLQSLTTAIPIPDKDESGIHLTAGIKEKMVIIW